MIVAHALKQSAFEDPPQTENWPAVTGQLAGRVQQVPVTLALHWFGAATPRLQKRPPEQPTLKVLQETAVSFGHEVPEEVTFTPSCAARLSFQ